uniref:Uncharacterized protein n=2 Tax=Panagrolaimus sp. JU765 TaxID=591449 RepID=A0AC34RBD2_9BILA
MEQNQKRVKPQPSSSFSSKSSFHRFDELKDPTSARKDIKKLVIRAIDQVAEQLKRIPKVQYSSAELISPNSDKMNAPSPRVIDQLENRRYYEPEPRNVQSVSPSMTESEREAKKECAKSRRCKKTLYPYDPTTEVELNGAFIGRDTVIACRHRVGHVREFLKPNSDLEPKHVVEDNRNLADDPNQNVIVMRNTGSDVAGIQFKLELKPRKSKEKKTVVSIVIPDLDELVGEIRI